MSSLIQTIIRGNSTLQVNGANPQGMFGGISVARSNSLRNTSPPSRRKYQPDQNYPPVPEDGHMGQMGNRAPPGTQHPQYPGPPPYNRENRDPYQEQHNRQHDNRDPRNSNMLPDKHNQQRDIRDNRYPNDRFDARDGHPDGRLQPPRDDIRGSHPNSRDQSFEQDRRSDDSFRRHNDSYDSRDMVRRDPHDMSPPRHSNVPPGGRSPSHQPMQAYPDERYNQQYPSANGTLPRQQPHQNMQGYNTLPKNPQHQQLDRVS